MTPWVPPAARLRCPQGKRPVEDRGQAAEGGTLRVKDDGGVGRCDDGWHGVRKAQAVADGIRSHGRAHGAGGAGGRDRQRMRANPARRGGGAEAVAA
jgi:hypothetical protein